MIKVKHVITSLALLLSHQLLQAQQEYHTRIFSISIDEKGEINSIKSSLSGKDYAVAANPGTLLQIVKNGKAIQPVRSTFNKEIITLFYPGDKKARVKASIKNSYIRFELIDISNDIDAITWGPVNNTIGDTIGNTIGVVRNHDFAIGIQGLNKKTSGGELVNEEGAVFENGTTATAKPFGSSLQAFTVNRSKDRRIKVWDRWPDVPVKAIPEGELQGSAIALFGCKPEKVIASIGIITHQENLPYAKWKNQWIKQSPESGRPYLITTFSESNIDTFLNYAKRMGMAGVYHEDPFEAWGHFVLKKSLFPNGRAGFKACVAKARTMGLRLGFHTLTTFITTNDAYVTPKPNPDLALAGTDTLTEDISAEADEIRLKSPEYFTMRSDLNSVRIGNEIIRFMDNTKAAPYRLTGCIRGAFGTTKTAHKAGEQVSRLIDHPYKVFFPGWELQKEITKNIADFINETGADQMDFDGHEGTYANGMGDLSFNTFAEEVFKQADHPVVFGSSRANHYFWHFNNYLNWGEPWYGGFRESQSDQRIINQKFDEVNYLPNMLGWFLITAQTSPDDIDWMLARAAGFNAGYALVVREDALGNPQMDEIIQLINKWTLVQRQNLFTAQQKQWLKNPNNEAHLVQENNKWYLQPLHKFNFEYEAKNLQPGQPASSSYNFENQQIKQVPQLIITASGTEGTIKDPVIEIDNAYHLKIPVTLTAGQTMVLSNVAIAGIYDQKGRLMNKVNLDSKLPELDKGNHEILFDAVINGSPTIKAKLTLKLVGSKEILLSKK